MSLLLLEAVKLEKSYGERKILDIKELRIYSGDKIGLIGENGSGKTTLLNILMGDTEPDRGIVRRYCDISYIRQLDKNFQETDGKKIREYGMRAKLSHEALSGGETSRMKLAEAFGNETRLFFADEPTSNLDFEGVKKLCADLSAVESFVLVSHDKTVLQSLCNKIIAVENCGLTFYDGGFLEYEEKLRARRERQQSEYEQYTKEKTRLEKVYLDKKKKARNAVKKPRNVSGSDAKARDFCATSRSFDGRQQGFERAAASVIARIEHMEVKEKPKTLPKIKLNFSLTEPPENKLVLSCDNLSFSYGQNRIFDKASFSVKNHSRTAVCGENGSGKTTLFNLISAENSPVYKVPKARIGYMYQGFENIDLKKTVLENVMSESVQNEASARSVLAGLLIRNTDINKTADVLSGGERIRLSLAKLLVSKINIILLDEPTNYLDMQSIEILLSVLSEYGGTLLFVSHDKSFTDALATDVLVIKDRDITHFEGNLSSYQSSQLKKPKSADKMILEHRLAALAGQISAAKTEEKAALAELYDSLSEELNSLCRGDS